VFKHGEHFDIQLTLPDGTRGPQMCQPPEMSEERARDKAKRLSELAAKTGATVARRARGAPSALPTISFAEWSELWIADRIKRGLTSVRADKGRLRKWILPKLGTKPIGEIVRRDVEELVEHLDECVRDELRSPKPRKLHAHFPSHAVSHQTLTSVLASLISPENETPRPPPTFTRIIGAPTLR
jgi:hypothetical protein